MRYLGRLALVFFFSVFACAPLAHAEKRIALLVGNQAYTSAIGALANPHNDVVRLERALNGLGFEVIVERDLGSAASPAPSMPTRDGCEQPVVMRLACSTTRATVLPTAARTI